MNEKVPRDDAEPNPWLSIVRGSGAARGESTLNPADVLLLEAWHLSVKQARHDRLDKASAKDVASESMVALVKRVAMDPTLLEQPAEFERLRRNITKTKTFDFRRRAMRAKKSHGEFLRILEESAPWWMIAERRVELNVESPRLNEALSQLSPECQVAVFLRHALGWKPGLIAEFTGIPLSTIKGQIHRGFTKLRDLMFDRSTDAMESES